MSTPILVQFRGARYRLVTAAKLVMWHGTTTGPDGETLRSILKQGLLPDPKKKAYENPYAGDDEDAVYTDGLDADTEESMILDTSPGERTARCFIINRCHVYFCAPAQKHENIS